ncbi:MAG: DNA mismatch endonuclease Vsr [Bryobacterales bacterium]|nr:DNA mismatch endonuclease Vsr [Bryobacterales bacterium]
MTDTFDPGARSWIMSRVPSRGTKPEQAVRKALMAAGRRFSSRGKKLPGNPDFVIPSLRLAVFVNGCFWHWHGCPRCRMPKSNHEYWERKIAGNVRRDRRSKRNLNADGWHYWTIWECGLDEGISRLLARTNVLAAKAKR